MHRFLFTRGFILPVTVVGIVPTVIVATTEAWRDVVFLSAVAGFVLFAAGLGLLVWTTRLFDAHGGALAPWNPPKTMVNHGPYEYTRNPMITGIFFMLAGEAFAFRSTHLAVWFSIFFFAQQAFIRFEEEPALRKRFGEAYERYCRTVPRWIPRLSRSRQS